MSCDDGYIPYLAATLTSIKKNRDEKREYAVRILFTQISEEYIDRIVSFYSEEGFEVEFHNISYAMEDILPKLHTRDYYSKTTYYRIFIPRLFSELDKALYLDCDISVCSDISEIYDTPLGDNLLAAITDAFVHKDETLSLYSKNRLGIDSKYYINAGIILMNLSVMREVDFEATFLRLISRVKFDVAQDQDYLNALCNGRIVYLGAEWNVMPFFTELSGKSPKIVHYNLDNKPWQKDGVPFGDIFFSYANECAYAKEISKAAANKDPERTKKSIEETKELVRLSLSEALDREENERIKNEINLCKKVIIRV